MIDNDVRIKNFVSLVRSSQNKRRVFIRFESGSD